MSVKLDQALIATDVAAALILAFQGGLALTPTGTIIVLAVAIFLLTDDSLADPGVPPELPNFPAHPLPKPLPKSSPPPSQFPNLPMGCGTYSGNYNPNNYIRALRIISATKSPDSPKTYFGKSLDKWEIFYEDCDGIKKQWADTTTDNDAFPGGVERFLAANAGQPPYTGGGSCPCAGYKDMADGCDCETIRQIIREELVAYLKCVRDKICSVPGQKIIDLGNVKESGTKQISLNTGENVNFIVATVLNDPMPPNIRTSFGHPNQYRLGEIAIGGSSALSEPVWFNFVQQVFPVFPTPCRSVYWRLEDELSVNLKAYVATPPPSQ